MKQRTKVMVAVGLVGALIVGMIVATQGAPDAPDGRDAGPGEAALSGAGKSPSPSTGGDFRPAGRYRLEYGVVLRMMQGAEAMGLPAESRMTVAAELELADAMLGDGWVAGRMRAVVLGGDEGLLGRAGLVKDMPADGLSAPFMVRFDATGAAVERRYSAAMPEGVRNVVGSILTGLQIVRPADAKVVDGKWDAPEEGLDGAYTASYAARADGVTKTWTRGFGEDGAAKRTLENPGKVVSLGTAMWVRAAESGRLTKGSLEVELTADLSLGRGAAAKLGSETTATLVWLDVVSGEWASTMRPEALAARDGVADIEARASADDPLPAPSGRSPAEIVFASAKANATMDSQGRLAAMRDLAATIRQDPGTTLAFIEERLRSDVDGDRLRTMVEALTVADTEESLGAMNAMLTDEEMPQTARHSLAIAAGMMDEPTPALVESLMAISRESLADNSVAYGALLGLAVQGNRQHAGPHTERIREDVLARADQILGPQELGAPPRSDVEPQLLQAWLTAVGNLGGEEAWPLVEPYMRHPDQWVRLAAVGALAYVPGPEVRLAVAEMIEVDPSHWVRRQAVRMAGDMPQSAFEDLVIRTMRNDDAENVRLECARVLAVWGLESPGLYRLIAEAAEREPDRTTKKIMGQLQPEHLGQSEIKIDFDSLPGTPSVEGTP